MDLGPIRTSGFRPDGTKVFFGLDRNAAINGAPLAAGLYVINADGTGLRRIVSPEAVYALFGRPVPEIPFAFGGAALDVSADGQRIVFNVMPDWNANYPPLTARLVRVNSDGSGLQEYAIFGSELPVLVNLGISGDGSIVFYVEARTTGELGVFNWDGSGQRVLDTMGGWNGTEGEVVQLSYDGSKLNHGSWNRLYNTDGSGVLQLAAYGATLTGRSAADGGLG